VFADSGDGWWSGFPLQGATGSGGKTISCPPEYAMPEGDEFFKCGCIRNKEIAAIGKEREDGAEH